MNEIKETFISKINWTENWIELIFKFEIETETDLDNFIDITNDLKEDFKSLSTTFNIEVKTILEYVATIEKIYYELIDYKISFRDESKTKQESKKYKSAFIQTLKTFKKEIKADCDTREIKIQKAKAGLKK